MAKNQVSDIYLEDLCFYLEDLCFEAQQAVFAKP